MVKGERECVYWGQVLGDEGAKELCERLSNEEPVKRLVVQGNKIGNAGLDALCHLVQVGPTWLVIWD
jgi:hypothetical protein